jgi:WhiB family transcriptional regulator, redox-sensing transcriptional regulator
MKAARRRVSSAATGLEPIPAREDRSVTDTVQIRPPGDPDRSPGWGDQALCAQSDPEAWFPEPGGSAPLAKAICRICPVQVPCLAYALDHPELRGIWGGLSERERRALRHPAGGAR